jgi:hypothetical protein
LRGLARRRGQRHGGRARRRRRQGDVGLAQLDREDDEPCAGQQGGEHRERARTEQRVLHDQAELGLLRRAGLRHAGRRRRIIRQGTRTGQTSRQLRQAIVGR